MPDYYTPSQIAQLAVNAGFTGDAVSTITAISLAESGGNPNNINYADPGGSYGLTQINGAAHGISTAQSALDPQTSLDLAYQISNGGTNFRPWSTYLNGVYQKFLPAALQGSATASIYPVDLGSTVSAVETGESAPGTTGGTSCANPPCSGALASAYNPLTWLFGGSGAQSSTAPGQTIGQEAAASPSLSSITSFFSTLTDANTWQRVALVGVGVIVLVAALFLLGYGNLSHAIERAAISGK